MTYASIATSVGMAVAIGSFMYFAVWLVLRVTTGRDQSGLGNGAPPMKGSFDPTMKVPLWANPFVVGAAMIALVGAITAMPMIIASIGARKLPLPQTPITAPQAPAVPSSVGPIKGDIDPSVPIATLIQDYMAKLAAGSSLPTAAEDLQRAKIDVAKKVLVIGRSLENLQRSKIADEASVRKWTEAQVLFYGFARADDVLHASCLRGSSQDSCMRDILKKKSYLVPLDKTLTATEASLLDVRTKQDGLFGFSPSVGVVSLGSSLPDTQKRIEASVDRASAAISELAKQK